MSAIAGAFRHCLEECDVIGIRRLWAHVAPDLPQPTNDHEALATLHRARTEARSIALRLRAYSHRWLLDHGYPSGLPDELKPRAERLYPQVVEAVGIAVGSKYPEVVTSIRGAMEYAVLDTHADGVTDPVIVKNRMMEARARERRALFGRCNPS